MRKVIKRTFSSRPEEVIMKNLCCPLATADPISPVFRPTHTPEQGWSVYAFFTRCSLEENHWIKRPLASQASIHPVKLACEANNPDLEFVKFWTPKSNKFLIGIASKPLVDRREVQALITHTVIIFNGIRELIPQKAGFGFSLVPCPSGQAGFLCIPACSRWIGIRRAGRQRNEHSFYNPARSLYYPRDDVQKH